MGIFYMISLVQHTTLLWSWIIMLYGIVLWVSTLTSLCAFRHLLLLTFLLEVVSTYIGVKMQQILLQASSWIRCMEYAKSTTYSILNLWLIIGHTPIHTRMSYSLPNLFLWASFQILRPYCNALFYHDTCLVGGLIVTHWDMWIATKQ